MKRAMLMLAVAVIFGLGTALVAQDDGNAGDGNGKKKAAKAARAAAKDNTDTTKDKVKDGKDAAKNKHGAVVDKRQDNQSKRIQHGINKGYLTPEETKGLQDQQQKIAAMESTYKSDGKLTKDECGQLKDELKVASANIWAEKHDTDGKQMPVYRLGKNVAAKDSLTSQLSNQNMTGAEAKALTGDFKKMLEMKRSLATDDLSADDRIKKQADYDALLNRYYEVR